ncbi:MAG: DUF4389 domain-containing protein [Chloroflexi bacterium]|nr:DUF4389 domain-containing protein [Chloroflexota bacterium]
MTYRAPHPVALDVAYPQRLSRVRIFFRLVLIIPQAIITYLLTIAGSAITVLAWFAILFTGRYPKGMFEFTSGVLRWTANVYAYMGLLRDEYPPFSWDAAAYPLTLDIPLVERQSRFRLFVRMFAVFPNAIVLYFVQLGALFTTFIAWWAILFSGRYPRGLHRFSVGVLRWQMRLTSYVWLLRDEYPPYSVNADARPGNEVVSAIIGAPLLVLYVALSALPAFSSVSNERVVVSAGTLAGADIARTRPVASGNNVRIALVGYEPKVTTLRLSRVAIEPTDTVVSFEVSAEKDGVWPVFFTSTLLFVKTCSGDSMMPVETAGDSGFDFSMWWRDGATRGTAYYALPQGEVVCSLEYRAGLGYIRFNFG